ncbi:hypothetical protein phytr_2240 [Candidatus Phycorickettsia trachydisci]|uniref:Uncharacterized protein n=1 Tax=Candidatus Phycorickettsia trachydisci TaxID=2115978 RepID=A0A2P1P7D6_9RICK|nr:hypothetical protein [Candidatus Phycorickettsia trachydisci]AVP87182.1 hypothetical protein phytr_2240 [Candidatus Phycorickettsia trachydisci]
MNHHYTNTNNISNIIAFDLVITILSICALTEIISQSNSITNHDLNPNMIHHNKLTFSIAIILLFSIYKTTLLGVVIFGAEIEDLEDPELLYTLEEDIHSDYIMDFDDMV